MLHHAISHTRSIGSARPLSLAQLMRESTERVRTALESSDLNEQTVARRIFESPAAWSQWESEHSTLMRQLAGYDAREAQVAALKHATFRLLHGKALFQYLRGSEVRGAERTQIMAYFRPGRSYEDAMVTEHNVYVRKACSYLCASHVGSDVVEDAAFLDPMQRYEELYAEYFSAYCRTLLVPSDTDSLAQQALLPLLKRQLNEYRWAMLDPRQAQPFLRYEAELRRATGDTQRLPALGSRAKKP